MGEELLNEVKTWVSRGWEAACIRQKHRSNCYGMHLEQRIWKVKTPSVILNQSYGYRVRGKGLAIFACSVPPQTSHI